MRITGTILFGRDPSELSQAQRDWILERAPEVKLLVNRDRDAIEAELERVEIAGEGVPHEWLARMPNLRWYMQFGAGIDWLLRYPELRERPFLMTNGSGIHAVPISEHILGMMLSFSRGLYRSARRQMRHEWPERCDEGLFELAGKTMVLVGVGAIGRRTARLAAAFEMRVIGVRRSFEHRVEGVERMVGPQALHSVLPEADFLVLTIPFTPDTRHFIAARELALLPSSAYLINIGRGGTVDEAALIAALSAGRLAGAGLDVFEEEPLPADSPLWEMEQVVMTPHCSGFMPQRAERAWALFTENFERYLADEPLRNLVDRRLGY